MNELINFNFNGSNVRALTINDEPYFVGKDVAEILGYSRPDNAIRNHVDTEDKLMHQISALGQNRTMTVINESGLYSLILSSKLDSAKQFKRWVTSEVLPAIRKHGAYMTDEKIDELVANPDLIIKLATELKEERTKSRLEQERRLIAEQQVSELKPKATYYDLVLQSKSVVAITKIAKDYGWSGKKLNAYLHDKKVQFKQGDNWLLYAKYADKGYTQSKTMPIGDGMHVKMHTYWTQKGRLFIYDLLRQDGILPMIERDESK